MTIVVDQEDSAKRTVQWSTASNDAHDQLNLLSRKTMNKQTKKSF